MIGDGERSRRRGRRASTRATFSSSTGSSSCCAPTTSARSSTTARAASAPTRSSGTTRRCRSAPRTRSTDERLDLPELPRVGDRAAARDAAGDDPLVVARPSRRAGGTRSTTTSPRSASRSRRTCRTRPGSRGARSCAASDACAIAYFGDGATSEGAFHEGANFAGVMRAPLDPLLQQQPVGDLDAARRRRPRAETLADKAVGYGMPGVRVDGGDVLAVYEATREAVARARAGDGPTFIEAVTYRAAPHATADDPSAYIDPERVEEEQARRVRRPLRGVPAAARACSTTRSRRAVRAEALRRCARGSPRPRPSRPPTPSWSSSTRTPTRRPTLAGCGWLVAELTLLEAVNDALHTELARDDRRDGDGRGRRPRRRRLPRDRRAARPLRRRTAASTRRSPRPGSSAPRSGSAWPAGGRSARCSTTRSRIPASTS